jgi:hypothetical protein
MVVMLQCGDDTESTEVSSTGNKATIEEQPHHDPLKIGYPIDIEKTDVVKQVEEMIAANIAMADMFSESEINEQVDSLIQQATSTPGVEPIPIKDENEMKLVRKYFREYLLTNYILHQCQLNNMITSPDRQRLSEKYCRFLCVYYNNAYGLSLSMGPEKP